MPDDEVTQPAAAPAAPAPPRLIPGPTPAELLQQEQRSRKLTLLVLRLLFMATLVSVTVLTIASRREDQPEEFQFAHIVGLFLAASAVAVIVLVVDAKMPNRRLGSMVGVYLGLCAGLVGALAIGALIDVVATAWSLNQSDATGGYVSLAKVMVAIVLCYFAVSVVLTTKDDFRLVIPYVEFAKQVRGVRPLLVDTSALIDGRIDGIAQTGFIDAPLVLPQFVVDELQVLADSSDKLKRARGRRGLSMVSKLQANPYVAISIDTSDMPRRSVDQMLVQMAADQSLRILTTDYNLNKVAQIRGVTVLNLHDVANALKSQAIPGETLVVEVVKRGESPGQGVGYMPDGTMVVIEDAADRIGESVTLTVTNSLTTTAGRMIFGTATNGSGSPPSSARAAIEQEERSHIEQMARAATNQPRTPIRSTRVDDPHAAASRRNPRRG